MTPMPDAKAKNVIAHAFMDAGAAALIALAILLPLVGLHAVQDIRNELVLETRFPLLAALVALVAAGRLFYNLVLAPWQVRRRERAVRRVAKDNAGSGLIRGLGSATILLVLAYPLAALWLAGPGGALKWVDNFGIQILIYVMLGLGLNIVVGLAGLLVLGYAAFYAIGAYAYALLAQQFGLSFFMLLPFAGILAAIGGLVLGLPVLRLRGDYLAIVTLAFGEIVRLVLINWVPVTNGYAGIASIPRPTFFGVPFNASDAGFAATFGLEFTPIHRTIFLYYIILALVLLAAAMTNSVAPTSDRTRMGSAARGRDRMPLSRHQYHQHQADRVCDRRRDRRRRRCVLRGSPGFHLA